MQGVATPYARRPLPQDIFDHTVTWLGEPRGVLKPSMPMLAGGLTAAMIEPLIRQTGHDVILGVGGAIQGHPQGAEAGARAVREAIDAAVRATAPASPAAEGGRDG